MVPAAGGSQMAEGRAEKGIWATVRPGRSPTGIGLRCGKVLGEAEPENDLKEMSYEYGKSVVRIRFIPDVTNRYSFWGTSMT